MTNAVAVFDFTHPFSEEVTHRSLIDAMYPNLVKKYSFQLERSDSGYEHFQGRVSLCKKRRLGEAIKLFKDVLPKLHLTITSNNAKDDVFYVIKSDTQIDGPWHDTDAKPQYIPRQIREIDSLYPWQNTVIELSKVWDTRSIHVIVDTRGNNGKSILSTYMGVYGLGRTLPFCNDYKDIMRMVCDLPTSNAYIIDMPRAISKERLFQMYSGIETVKSGYAFDDRYHFKDKYFDCPQIFIFTNQEPDEDLLSKDRWKIWTINPTDKSLEAAKACNNIKI